LPVVATSVTALRVHSGSAKCCWYAASRTGRAIQNPILPNIRLTPLEAEVGGKCGAGVTGNDGDGAAGLDRCDDQVGRSWRGPCCLDRADFERGEQLLHGDRDQVAEAADVFARSIPGPGGAGVSKSVSKKAPTGQARGR
jgi:hypothetical protein